MGKQYVVHGYVCIKYPLFGNKKKCATKWMNPEDIMLSEISHILKKQIVYDSSYMKYIEEANSYR